MLTLRQTGFADDRMTPVWESIRRYIGEGQRVYLLVPEQETVQAEKEATLRLPPDAPILFEVTNFTRLANTVFRAVGGISGRYSDKAAKALLMWQALSEAAPLLSSPSGKEITAGEVERALSAMGEMKSLGIDAAVLSEAAETDDVRVSERLRGKLRDLSLILTLFTKLHNCTFSDAADDVSALADTLRKHPEILADAVFFLDGFTSFTEPQCRVLLSLLGRTDITVNLLLPRGAEDAFEYTETRRTAEKLLRLADLAGTPKKRERSCENNRIRDVGMYEISRILWRQNAITDNNYLQNTPNFLRIYEGDTVFDAAEFAANLIAKKVAEGCRYSDFAIVMRHADTYYGIIDAALSESGIPFFLSQKRDISQLEGAKKIDAAFRAALGGFRREDVIAYMKCGLSDISVEDGGLFELYVEKWQIDGAQFLREGMWNMNPDGYTERRAPDADERLLRIDRVRHCLTDALAEFADNIRRPAPMKEQASALVRFLLAIDMEGALARRAAEATAAGEEETATDNMRLLPLLYDALARMVEVLPDMTPDGRTFYTLLRIALSAADVGRIPAHADEVTLGNADMLRLHGKKHVILFGVHRGEFPATVKDDAWFSEKEKSVLRDLGLAAEPTGKVKNARELFCFARAFSSASESVTLIFSDRSASFTPLYPSDVISHIAEVTDGKIRPRRISSLPLSERVQTRSAALSAYGSAALGTSDAKTLADALRGSEYEHTLAVADGRITNDRLSLSRATTALLYGKSIGLTQTRMDQFVRCPMQHFCLYVLRLGDERRATFDVMNVGTFIHALLEKFFSSLKEEHTEIASLTEEDCSRRIRTLADEYMARLHSDEMQKTARLSHTVDSLTTAAAGIAGGICEELADCRYYPTFFELPIEKNEDESTPAPVEYRTSDGGTVYVYGTIDRVDVYPVNGNVYVRVIDYKTGRKEFSPSDLAEGRNLQLFLYLRSVVESETFRHRLGVSEGGKVIPGGAMYVSARVDDQPLSSPSENALAIFRAGQSRRGMLLDDPVSIAAMSKRYIPIRFTKDNIPDKRSADKLYTKDGWDALCRTVTDSVVRIAEDMKSGRIPAGGTDGKHASSACDTCPYKPVCRSVAR